MLGRLMAALALACAMAVAAEGATLDDVKARGKFLCGVNPGLQGFAMQGPDGAWSGFDVDYCKALAAAVLGDAGKAEFMPLDAQERFQALKSGIVDELRATPPGRWNARRNGRCASPACPTMTGRASSSRSCWA